MDDENIAADRSGILDRGPVWEREESVESQLALDATENYGYHSEFAYEGFPGEYGGGFEEYNSSRTNGPAVQLSGSLSEEDAYPETALTVHEASECLSRIGQVGCGLLYAYTQINLNHRNLTDIEEIANFKYLSLVDVSDNHLDLYGLDAIRALPHAVVVRADRNAVNSLCLTSMPYLQVLTLNSNRVTSLSGLKQPSLECLELNDNKIHRLVQEPSTNFNSNYCNETDCPNLVTLALSRNALETDAVFEQLTSVSINLRILYLSYNKIESLRGLGTLPNLCRLHLRGNRISKLDGITDNLKHLSYLNLRENRLADTRELTKLACLGGSLKTVVLSENRFGQTSRAYRPYLAKLLPRLERLDKQTVARNASGDDHYGGDSGWQETGEEGLQDPGEYEREET